MEDDVYPDLIWVDTRMNAMSGELRHEEVKAFYRREHKSLWLH